MIPFLKKNKDGKKPPKPTVPRTAQESIPFQRMFEDGTCRVRPGYYTRTIQYQDINYQLAQQEDKTAIFEEWCSFLNFFDSSIHFELSFVNTATDSADFEKSIRIPYQQDGFDDVRAEYSQMLRQQLSKGNNGLTKTKFLTYGIEGDSMAQVKPRLEHIQNDLMNNFHRLGVLAKPLDGTERLRLMHGMLNMDGANKFHFNWKDLVPSGLSVKDAIAPTALAFKNSRTFQMGGIFGAVSFLNITASDLSDQLLKDFLDMDSSQIVTMHIQSVDQNKAIRTIKHTITELDRSKIEEQKKAVRAGYDMDVLPSDLATYGRDAKALLKELQSQNERMFLVTFLVLNTGKTEQELETNVFQAVSIAQKHNCELCRLDFQQEQGLMSSLPLADCQIEIQRGLTTSSTAIFVPFTTQELFDNGEESLYYGLNALSNNLIMVDRKKLKNPNGLILGTPGSGKSFSAKREICNAFLVTDDDIIICDPEAEYAPLVERLHGQVIHISPASTQYINPMDINSNYSEEDNPLALKADFVLSLCELVVGGKEGLQPVEKTVIDRCVHVIYRKYFENPIPENMPLLEDLYNALLTQDEPEARHVAAALEIYVKGSLNIFNHHTNVDINNRIVCFDIKQLGKQLKKLGMNNKVELNIPLKDKVETYLLSHSIAERDGKRLIPIHRPILLNRTDLEIVMIYNAELRGLCNYYAIASNFNKLVYFGYLMEYSCLKTLANKHRSRIAKVRYEYRDGTGAWGVPYETKKGKRRMMFAKYSDCKGKDLTEKVPDLAYRYSHNTTSFEERLKAKVCEVCGCTDSDSYEIHHVNKVKNLKGKADWEKVMLAKRRKTIVVCHKCHMRIHHGTKTE